MIEEIRKLQERKQKLLEAVRATKEKKKGVIKIVQDLLSQYNSGRLSRQEYDGKVRESLDKRSSEQWIKYYDDFLSYYEYQIKLCARLIKQGKLESIKQTIKGKSVLILKILIVLVLLGLIVSLFFIFKPSMREFFEGIGEKIVVDETIPVLLEPGVELIEESLFQYPAVLGKPVKWKKQFVIDSVSDFTLELPEDSENVVVKQIKQGKEQDISSIVKVDKKGIFRKRVEVGINKKTITGSAVLDVGSGEIGYEVEYETPAPEIFEEDIDKGKRITIRGPDDVHYENILSFTKIPQGFGQEDRGRIKLYEIRNNQRIATEFSVYDTDEDGVIDFIEWITPYLSEAVFEIVIEISKAEHLDSDKNFISDIYEQVKAQDDVWSEEIFDGDYVRVTFEQALDNTKDITLYPRIISGEPRIEVYEFGESVVLAEFENLTQGKNTVYLTELAGSQDVFDLRIVNGSVEIDYVVDPLLFTSSASGSTADLWDIPMTWTHNIACDYDQVLIVGIAIDRPNYVAEVSAVYYDGIPLSKIGSHSSAGSYIRGEMWNLTNPPCGSSKVINVTFLPEGNAEEAAGVSSVYSGVEMINISSVITDSSTGGGDAIISPRPLAEEDQWVVDLLAYDNLPIPVDSVQGENQVLREQIDQGTVSAGTSDGNDTDADGDVEMSWGLSGDDWVWVGVTLIPRGLPAVNLISPEDATSSSPSTVWFSSDYTSNNNEWKNTTLYIWDSTGSIVNNTENRIITGIQNSTNISVTLSQYGLYYWNYYACDQAHNCIWSAANYTFTIVHLVENSIWQENLTGVSAGSIAWGDVDGDGDLDLAASDAKIYINNGTSLIENQTWQENLTGMMLGSIAWGDVDGDGDLDLALFGDSGAKIYINNGTSLVENSTWQGNLLGGLESSIAWGDVDGDGDLDLAWVGGAFGNSKIYINNGTSLVENSTWQENLIELWMGSIAWADIDGDGDLDLALTGGDSGLNSHAKIYTNDGTSLVENSTWQGNLTAVRMSSIAWGDIDGDGDLDLALTGSDGSNEIAKIYINNGTSLVENSMWQENLVGLVRGSITWGDVDNDGDLDLAASDAKIYINNGTSLIEDYAWQGNLTDVGMSSIAWGDVDGDGDLDLALTGRYGSNDLVKIYINDIASVNPNTAPTPPTNFSGSYFEGKLTLSWGNGSDVETLSDGLYYNLRVGTSSGGNDIVTGKYGGSGHPTAQYFGNMMQRRSISLTASNQDYYWSVQTIDTSLNASSWSAEQMLVPPPTVDLISPADSAAIATDVLPSTVWFVSNYTINTNEWKNTTLYIWDSTGSIINNTENKIITGIQNSTNVPVTLSQYGLYYWNYYACDQINNCYWSDTNYTFIITILPRLVENQTWQENLTGVDSSSIAWGDVDNDGDLDLALTGLDSDSNYFAKIYINNGTSLIENSTWQKDLTGVYVSSIAWGDVNNDGNLDLALFGYNDSNRIAKIYINNGTSLIENPTWQENLTAVDYSSITLGDVDNDGDLDLALTGFDPDSSYLAKIYINTGTSLIENSAWQENLTGVTMSSIAWGDIDGDGDLDLALTGFDEMFLFSKIYINTGTSLVESPTWQENLAVVYQSSIAWGDVDGDGDLDLVLTGNNNPNKTAKIYINNGTSLIENQTWQEDLTGVAMGSIAWGDVDNDGDLDLALTGEAFDGDDYYYSAKIYINNGTSLIEDYAWQGNLTEVYISSIAWGDVDSDGDLDLALTGYNGSNKIAKIYINEIITPNTVPTPPTRGFSSSYSGGKLNLSWGNGNDAETPLDGLYYNLRVGTSSGGNDIVTGKYGGSGTPPAQYFGNMMQRRNISLAVSSQTSQTYYWSVQTIDTSLNASSWSAEQSYVFVAPLPSLVENQTWQQNLTGVDHSSIAWGDIDGDGDLDLALTGGWDPDYYAKIYINNGTSLVEDSTWQEDLIGVGDSSIAWGDIDNDGSLDLALTGRIGATRYAKIYINTGTSLVEDSTWQANLVGVAYGSISWGDVDNDGDLDLALTGGADLLDYYAKIYINTGTSLVESSVWQENLIEVGFSSTAWGDVDGDGDLDLALIGRIYIESPPEFVYYSKIYINTGTSLVESAIWQGNLTEAYRASIAWGDVDNDGDLDLAFTGTGNSKIYINNGTSLVESSVWQEDLTGVSESSTAWGDVNNDGYLDLVLTGRTGGSSKISRVYTNNGTSLVRNYSWYKWLTRVDYGSISWVDVDNDGALDLILTGYDGSRDIAEIYTNTIINSNTAPAPPTSFSSSYSGGELTLSWGKGSDTETLSDGLYYNLRVGTSSGGNDIVTGIYGGSGKPPAQYFGNMMQRRDISLAVSNQTYYWSVQTIDTSLKAGNWGAEQTYPMGPDTTPPDINFEPPTRDDGSSQDWDSIFVNVSASDVGKGNSFISTFIDFDNSLVGWWRMDDVNSSGDPTDYTGINNGTAQGGAVQGEGYLGKGFEFDGDGDYVEVAYDIDINLSTFGAWVKPTLVGDSPGMVLAKQSSYYMAIHTNGAHEFCWLGLSDLCAIGAGNEIAAGEWQHIMAVYNGTNMIVYVNGEEIDNEVSTGSVAQNDNNLYFGKWPGGGANDFNGTIDDVMIFNRALSAEEISALYANTSTTYLEHDFTDLTFGNYTFKAYAQDTAGNVNTTEEREVEIITIAEEPPEIIYVENIPDVDPTAGSIENVNFVFTAYDANGFNDLNDSSARANFTKEGYTSESLKREDLNCSRIAEWDSYYANYSCTIGLWYFDEPGFWNITVAIADNEEEWAVNDSESFFYKFYTDFICFPTLLDWGILERGTEDHLLPYPVTINNTGNMDIEIFKINASNLFEEDYPELVFGVGNFSVDVSHVCEGTGLVHDEKIDILNSGVAHGNLSLGGGVAQGNLSFCLEQIPPDLLGRTYSTPEERGWIIGVLVVSVIIRNKKKKSKKRKKKYNLSENDLLVLNKRLKEKYNIGIEELLEISEKREYEDELEVQVPVNIFNQQISPAEALCKYLKENIGLNFRNIAKLINRDERTVWINYRNSVKKKKEKIKVEKKTVGREIAISIKIFSDRRLSILESVVNYLKKKEFRNSEISEMLGKDQRNICTLYSRVKKKFVKEVFK